MGTTNQFIGIVVIAIISGIVSELSKRLTTVLVDKTKNVVTKPTVKVIVRTIFNKQLIVPVIQLIFLGMLAYLFISSLLLDGLVTRLDVAYMIILFSVALRIGYNFYISFQKYYVYATVYYKLFK